MRLYITTDIEQWNSWSGNQRSIPINNIRDADDTVLLAEKIGDLQRLAQKVNMNLSNTKPRKNISIELLQNNNQTIKWLCNRIKKKNRNDTGRGSEDETIFFCKKH